MFVYNFFKHLQAVSEERRKFAHQRFGIRIFFFKRNNKYIMSPEKTDIEVSAVAEDSPIAPNESAESTAAANLSTVSIDSTNGEHDPYYEPVISLPEVDTKTNEEDEEVLYKERCKLFRYASDTAEWKERGTGNVKLLKDPKKGTVRLLMRQEKTLKVRANHYMTPYTRLKPSAGSERAFVWYVMLDFADEEAKSETFAIRFGNAEIAKSFKEQIEEAVNYVTTTTAGLEFSDDDEFEEVEIQDEEDEEKENKDTNKMPEQSDEKDTKESDEKATKSDEASKVPSDLKTESDVVEDLQKLSVKSETVTESS